MRTLVAGYLRDLSGKFVRIIDLVTTAEAVDISAVPALLLAKAARDGLALRAGSPLDRDIALPLLPIPRPAAGDTRPLLAWAVTTYIVAHDVKFGGYAKGVFAWPEQPAGPALEAMVHVLMTDTLARLFLEPPEIMQADIISVAVTPSPEPPADYA